MENKGIWEYNFRVRSFDVDKSRQMTPTAISEYLQEVAGDHANSIGFGYRQVIRQDMVWVLNSLRIEIKRLPEWEENIKIETWVVENIKFLSRRDFRWFDSRGEIVLNATTNWILFHTKKLRPQLVEQMNFPVTMRPELKATEKATQNLREKFEDIESSSYEVRYSDLDMVGHMNNTKYIRLLSDAYDAEFHEQNKLKSLDINFKTEARYGDILLQKRKEAAEGIFQHQLSRKEDSKVNCIAELEWESIL